MKSRVQTSLTLLIGLLFTHVLACEGLDSSKNDITVCDGDDALFSWPCNIHYDYELVKNVTLTFNKISDHGQVLAAMSGEGTVTFSKEYSDRMTARGTSGVRLQNVGILDSGIYSSRAEFLNGTVKEKHLTLMVQIPPLLMEITADFSLSNTRKECQQITCGHVIFPGFPPVSFQWNTPRGIKKKVATSGMSIIRGCPLSPGNYTCHLTGPALNCGNHSLGLPLLDSASVQISSRSNSTVDMAKAEAERAEAERRELILVIVVPIVTVSFPMIVLLLWVLKHYVTDSKGYSTARKDHPEAGARAEKPLNTKDALVKVALAGISVASRSPIDHMESPTFPSSPETQPLTSCTDDPAEEEVAEEEKEDAAETEEEEAAGSEPDLMGDMDLIIPLVDAEAELTISDSDETRM